MTSIAHAGDALWTEATRRLDSTTECLTGLQAYDAMIAVLEKCASEFPAAHVLLSELYYSDAREWELGTRDPRTWGDWVEHLTAAIEGAQRNGA